MVLGFIPLSAFHISGRKSGKLPLSEFRFEELEGLLQPLYEVRLARKHMACALIDACSSYPVPLCRPGLCAFNWLGEEGLKVARDVMAGHEARLNHSAAEM